MKVVDRCIFGAPLRYFARSTCAVGGQVVGARHAHRFAAARGSAPALRAHLPASLSASRLVVQAMGRLRKMRA
jgi:hypothetical protein